MKINWNTAVTMATGALLAAFAMHLAKQTMARLNSGNSAQ